MRPLAQNRGGPWSSADFPDSLRDATARLSEHVVSHVDPSGAVRFPCRGRPLETALLLRLLESTGQPFDRQERYLRSLPPESDPLDLAIARAALSRTGKLAPELRENVVAKSPDFTGPRKRALLDGVFAILGEPVAGDPESYRDTLRRNGLHSWAQVQVTALKGVLTGSLTDEDVHVLAATQRLPGIWEGNLLIHLFTLHALRRLPGTEAVVADGIRKALEHVRSDGSVPFVTDTDTWCTVTAGVALAAADAPEPVLRRITERLVHCQQPGGGWSVTDAALQTDVDDTSVALQFLRSRVDRSGERAVERGLASLSAVRHPRGGFPTYVSDSAPEACMTVAALDAFTFDAERHREVLTEGLSFLAGEQLADGTFPPDWSSSRLHTVFRAVLLTSRIPDGFPGPAGEIAERALRFVLRSQNEDGGWGQEAGSASDPISTSYAVMALCAQEDPRPAAAGVRFLLRHQRDNGGITSVSDSIGPRPFIFHVPLLADIFALMALGHVTRRVDGHEHRPSQRHVRSRAPRTPAVAAVHGVLPPHRYPQARITDMIARLSLPDPGARAELERFHTNARVATRHLALPIEDYAGLDGFGAANDAFLAAAVDLGCEAVLGALSAAGLTPTDVDVVMSTTVTGIAVPSLDARIAARIGMRPDVRRMPLMGLGCLGGAAGVARLNDVLLGAPNSVAVLVSVELCSLTMRRDDSSTANMIASGLFGDGAAAVVVVGADHPRGSLGPRVVDSASHLYPDSERAMGWDVGGGGLKIVLGAEVPDLVRTHLADDVKTLLAPHGLEIDDIARWICHPGGPKVVETIQSVLGLGRDDLAMTWNSLNRIGNVSSASVLHVFADTLAERPAAPGDWGVLMAMGPGFSAELVLLRW